MNNYKRPGWVERLIWSMPWLTVGVLFVGAAPGFLHWLITGTGVRWLATELVLTFTAVILLWGSITWFVPFLGRPGAERFGFAALGGFLWGFGIFLATLFFYGASMLLSARVGTVAFVVATCAGLVVQQLLLKRLS